MTVVDSSGWIEFFRDGPKAKAFGSYVAEPSRVLTPSIVIYEVYRKLKRELGQDVADLCVAYMKKTQLISLDPVIALQAADLSLEYSLAMADALILACARAHGARLVTRDADFASVPGTQVL